MQNIGKLNNTLMDRPTDLGIFLKNIRGAYSPHFRLSSITKAILAVFEI